MRTHLLAFAATLTLAGFATAALAASASTPSGGSAGGGGVSAPSGGGFSGGSSGGSAGASASGSSSHGGGGGGGGAAHGGGSAGAANRGGGFEGRSGFNGYGNFGSQGRDIAHGGYQVLATRPANMITSAAVPAHSTHTSLVLGPALGSAAQATRMSDDKRWVRGNTDMHHHHFLHRVALFRDAHCRANDCLSVAQEMCPHWVIREGDHYEMNSPLDCPQPVKLLPNRPR
jgi:hypothetical protein